MFCYLDRTFCPFNKDCGKADECPRAFTDYHRDRAIEFGMPVSLFLAVPDCYVKVEEICSTSSPKL